MNDTFQRMRDDLRLRNYSRRTEAIYLERVTALGRYHGMPPDELDADQVRGYLLYVINGRACS